MSSLRKESMCRCHSMWVKYNWTQGWRQFSFPRVIPTINSEGHLKKGGGGGGNLLQSPSLGLSCSDGAHEWSGLWRGILLLLFLKPLFKSTIQSSAPWTGLMPVSSWSTLTVINTFWGRVWLANEFTKCLWIQNVKCCEWRSISGQEQTKTRC